MKAFRGFLENQGKIISQETVDIIEESRTVIRDSKIECHRELFRDAIHAMREDLEARVRGLCEQVEGHPNTRGSRLDNDAIRIPRSTGPQSCFPTVRTADGTILSEETEVRARWTGYFSEFTRLDPPSCVFSANETVTLVADNWSPCQL